MATAAELTIDTAATATEMADEMFGDGITVVSASYSGDALSSATYSGGDTTSAGVLPGDTGVIFSTGHVDDFTNATGGTNTNQSASTSTNTSGANNDTDFNALAGTGTLDASFMEITFIPTGDTLTLDFVLASEEYPEWINSAYNDVAGLWVNGVEAQVTIGDGSASIGNLNEGDTENLYVDNTGDQYNTEMDGFTITLSFIAPVNVGVVNTLKIGVADVGDSTYDTNLIIAGDSIQTAIVADDDTFNMGINSTKTVDVLDNDSSTAAGALSITHINGIAVVAGDTVILATGQSITLNADGTLTVLSDGDGETANFTYTILDGDGNTDDAIVTFTQMACFTKGTQILTETGEMPIDEIAAGDLVETIDDGLQPVRWIGHSRVSTRDRHAPVLFRRGALGNDRDIRVSPQHRMLITDSWADLLFGDNEVLIKAKDLLNDFSIIIDRSEPFVDYYHLLFDKHQLITANGVVSESHHPGPQTMQGFDAGTQAEITTLIPQLDLYSGLGYGPAARHSLKAFEASVLLAKSPALKQAS